MSKEAIEEFGRQVVLDVRDSAMPQCDLLLRRDRQTADAKRLRTAEAAGGHVFAQMLIPECVDTAVFYILHAMDHDCSLHVLFTASNNEMVDISAVGWGEPIGWYIGIPGWRKWYSSQRIVDPENYFVDDPDDPAPNLDDLEMPRRAIEELGQLLVRHVRDVAIQSCDLQLQPHSQSPVAKRWRQAAAQNEGKVPPDVLIPDCVDETIFTLLHAIDKGLLPLSFTAENGECVDLVKEGGGELASMYMRPGGWREQHTKQRFAKNA